MGETLLGIFLLFWVVVFLLVIIKGTVSIFVNSFLIGVIVLVLFPPGFFMWAFIEGVAKTRNDNNNN